MDWTQTKAIAEANLDAIVGKSPNPRAVLTALSGKITAEVSKVEAYLASLDTRAMDLPNLLEQADQKVAKVQAVIAKAKSDGRADLAAAAQGRLAKEAGDRDALQKEFDNLEQTQMTADEWLSKLQDKSLEIEARITRLPPDKKPAPGEAAAPVDLSAVEALTTSAPKPAPTSPAPALKPAPAAPAPAPRPAAPAPAPKPAPAAAPAAAAKPAAPAAKPAGKKDALDDEFAALFAELNVDPSKIELPKKAAPKALEVDDKIPDLVTVADNELPEGEELPPLEMPKKGAPAKPGAPAPAAAKPGTGAPAKPTAAAPAKAPTPAPKAATPAAKSSPTPAQPAAEPPSSGSKTWLWVSLGIVGLGGAGAAVAHFVYGLF
jgi:phage shock protein A